MSVNAHKAEFGPPMTLGNMREALYFLRLSVGRSRKFR